MKSQMTWNVFFAHSTILYSPSVCTQRTENTLERAHHSRFRDVVGGKGLAAVACLRNSRSRTELELSHSDSQWHTEASLAAPTMRPFIPLQRRWNADGAPAGTLPLPDSTLPLLLCFQPCSSQTAMGHRDVAIGSLFPMVFTKMRALSPNRHASQSNSSHHGESKMLGKLKVTNCLHE